LPEVFAKLVTPDKANFQLKFKGWYATERNVKFSPRVIYGQGDFVSSEFFFAPHRISPLGCFVLIGFLMLRRWHNKTDLLFYAIAFLLGPLGRAIAVRSGAWIYAKPSFLIPLRLPLLWGIVLLFLKKFCEALAGEK
jgi:hypothetical protein